MPSIRVTGTIDEIVRIVDKLQCTFNVSHVSRYYKNRGTNQYHVYVDIDD